MEYWMSCTGAHILDVCSFYGHFIMTTKVNFHDATPHGLRRETYRLYLLVSSVGCLTDNRILIVEGAIPSG